MFVRKTAYAVVNDIAKSKTIVARAMIQGDRLILECLKTDASNRPHRTTHVPIRNGMVSVRTLEQGLEQIEAYASPAPDEEPPQDSD